MDLRGDWHVLVPSIINSRVTPVSIISGSNKYIGVMLHLSSWNHTLRWNYLSELKNVIQTH